MANIRKHGVSFQLASTIFQDPALFSTADLEHNRNEERWFAIGWATNGAILSVVYLWDLANSEITKIRLISARQSTAREIWQYKEIP